MDDIRKKELKAVLEFAEDIQLRAQDLLKDMDVTSYRVRQSIRHLEELENEADRLKGKTRRSLKDISEPVCRS